MDSLNSSVYSFHCHKGSGQVVLSPYYRLNDQFGYKNNDPNSGTPRIATRNGFDTGNVGPNGDIDGKTNNLT
jgi:hypothetical protein